MKTMKVTLEEQVTDDIRVIMEIADTLLGERKMLMSSDGYFKFLEVVEKHLHYCLDNYKFIDDDCPKDVLPT